MVYLPNYHRFIIQEHLRTMNASKKAVQQSESTPNVTNPSPFTDTEPPTPFIVKNSSRTGMIIPCVDPNGQLHVGHAFTRYGDPFSKKDILEYGTPADLETGDVTKKDNCRIGPHLQCRYCGLIRLLKGT